MTNDSRLTQNADYERHKRTGEGYAYCAQAHEGVTDAERKEWCRVYHTPKLPAQIDSSGARS